LVKTATSEPRDVQGSSPRAWKDCSSISHIVPRNNLWLATALLHMPPCKLRGARPCRTFLAFSDPARSFNCLVRVRSPACTLLFAPKACSLVQKACYTAEATEAVPFRKQLKDEVRASRSDKRSSIWDLVPDETRKKYELTVGIEIHAQLNTAHKLFSGEYHIASHDSL
jgi:hypothetical protein